MSDKKTATSSLKGHWFAIILFGFVGQFAWNIENMYFNTFLFNYIGGTTTDIANMVMASAITATLTALFMGALSDKLNKRKMFICLGTILWGISTLAFAFISRENVALIMRNASMFQITTVAVIIVIVMDCVMTFFGSMSSDGAFNSWITDITDDTNRAKVEGVLSSLPMISMLVVVGASGMLIDALGYPMFFIFIGGLVTLSGIIGLFIVKESRSGITSSDKYIDNVLHGFKLSVIKKNKNLYILFIALAVFNIGMQVYMPYFIIYMEKFLLFDAMGYSLVLGLGILVSSIIGITLGGKIDTYGKDRFMYPSIAIYIVGLVATFFFRGLVPMIFVVIIVLVGNLLVTIILNAAIRQYTPEDKVGLFQGVRMIFFVMIPMVIGPYIGNAVIKSSNTTFTNEFGEIVNVPVPGIFLTSALVTLLVLIPVIILQKNEKKIGK